MHIFSWQSWAYHVVFSSDKIYEQVIYTVGRDLQYQNTVVADTAPLVTAPVVVCTSTSEIFRTSTRDLFSFMTKSCFQWLMALSLYGTRGEKKPKFSFSSTIVNFASTWCLVQQGAVPVLVKARRALKCKGHLEFRSKAQARAWLKWSAHF